MGIRYLWKKLIAYFFGAWRRGCILIGSVMVGYAWCISMFLGIGNGGTERGRRNIPLFS
jgi:hypothetical protein